MSVGATVQRYTVSYGLHGHVEYIVKVDYCGKEWAVRKRYSEFDCFNSKIRLSGFNIPAKLPPKLFFGNLSEEQIMNRMRELDLYLRALMSVVPADNSLLKEFLDVESFMLAIEINQTPTVVQLSAADRVREIIRVAEMSFIHVDAHWRLLNCGDVFPSRLRSFRPPKKRKSSRYKSKHSFASSTGSHDSRMISTASSSNLDPSDVSILRRLIRDNYIEQANSTWSRTPSWSSGRSPHSSYKHVSNVPPVPLPPPPTLCLPPSELDDTVVMTQPPVGAVLPTQGTHAPPSIYDAAERRSNDLFIEQRHILSVLTTPVSTSSLRQMDYMVQVIDRIALTNCAVKVPLSDVLTDIHSSACAAGETDVLVGVSADQQRHSNLRKDDGKQKQPQQQYVRTRPSEVVLRLRHTIADSETNDLPGSSTQGGASTRKKVTY